MTGARITIAFGALAAALVGVAFFNLIIGVFGWTQSILGLAAFIVFAIFVARTPQPDEE